MKSFDVLLRELDLWCSDLGWYTGRKGGESNDHSRYGETKNLVHGGAPTLTHLARCTLPMSKFGRVISPGWRTCQFRRLIPLSELTGM